MPNLFGAKVSPMIPGKSQFVFDTQLVVAKSIQEVIHSAHLCSLSNMACEGGKHNIQYQTTK